MVKNVFIHILAHIELDMKSIVIWLLQIKLKNKNKCKN